jgi:hypothetical protein
LFLPVFVIAVTINILPVMKLFIDEGHRQ